MDEATLPTPGVTGTGTFRVEPPHTTNVFGPQDDPPGLPAAADATPEEAVRVLGTPHLVARAEFACRESLNGRLPPETGVVGERVEVAHRGAVPVGADVRVETELTTVEGRRLVFDATLRRRDAPTGPDSEVVGLVTVVLRVVERERFRAAVEG